MRDTVREFEATGSPVITDGEQRKYHNFWDYPVQGLANTAPDGFRIPFAAGHTRRMPRLMRGPFSYKRYADEFLAEALRYATRAGQAGGDLAFGAEPHVSGRGHSRLFARRVHPRPAARARDRDPPLPAARRAQRADRLHRGPPGDEARPDRRAAQPLHRAEQPGARALLRRGARAPGRAYLPRRRPRFDAQRGRRLRAAAAEPVRARTCGTSSSRSPANRTACAR